MLALAKDVTKNDYEHPEESKHPDMKEYMDYQRKLNHDRILYHSLDHAKEYLQKNIEASRGEEEKVLAYLKSAFPISLRFAESNTIMLMLRKLINAQNATNNWYRLNDYYYAVLYECVERFVKIYNRLLDENPDKAKEYALSDGVKIDFDDWVQLYFQGLDFLIGSPTPYAHYTYYRRNKAIEEALEKELKGGKTRAEALDAVQADFEISDVAVKVLKGDKISGQDLELFYTSVENPIYEYLYETGSESGLMDDESLLDHSYFMGRQLFGLNLEEAQRIVDEVEKMAGK